METHLDEHNSRHIKHDNTSNLPHGWVYGPVFYSYIAITFGGLTAGSV